MGRTTRSAIAMVISVRVVREQSAGVVEQAGREAVVIERDGHASVVKNMTGASVAAQLERPLTYLTHFA